jgi:hypothetical protein
MKESVYEKVNDFKYQGATLNTNNDWSKEINIRLNKAEKLSMLFRNSSTLKCCQEKSQTIYSYNRTNSDIQM